jgi:hypothetical protein
VAGLAGVADGAERLADLLLVASARGGDEASRGLLEVGGLRLEVVHVAPDLGLRLVRRAGLGAGGKPSTIIGATCCRRVACSSTFLASKGISPFIMAPIGVMFQPSSVRAAWRYLMV